MSLATTYVRRYPRLALKLTIFLAGTCCMNRAQSHELSRVRKGCNHAQDLHENGSFLIGSHPHNCCLPERSRRRAATEAKSKDPNALQNGQAHIREFWPRTQPHSLRKAPETAWRGMHRGILRLRPPRASAPLSVREICATTNVILPTSSTTRFN